MRGEEAVERARIEAWEADDPYFWKPRSAGADYATHRFERRGDVLTLVPTHRHKHLLVTVALAAGNLAFFTTRETLAPAASAGLGVVAAGVAYVVARRPSKNTAIDMAARVVRHRTGDAIPFERVAALQVLEKHLRSTREGGETRLWTSHEVHLVDADGTRFGLLDHGDRDVLRSQLGELQSLLEVPIIRPPDEGEG